MQTSPSLVLVVDDEKHIANAAAMFLRRAGYKTLVASSATEALAAWNDSIDLLITDWAMPDLFGDELAARLLERKPTLKLVMMSGNALGSIESIIPLEMGVNFIPKPFQGEELIGLVRQVLDDKVDSASPKLPG